MLYTRKGDKGDTYFFGCNQRFSKSSELAEALGALDEINSFLGLCKVRAQTHADFTQTNTDITVMNFDIPAIIQIVQENLFIIQAALAGAAKKINQETILAAEKIIDEIEKELPPIKTFFISGGTELGALWTTAALLRGEQSAALWLYPKKKK